MLRSTVRNTRTVFGLILLLIIVATVYYTFSTNNSYTSKGNIFIDNVVFFKPKAGKNVLFEIKPKLKLDKKSMEDKNNYEIIQVSNKDKQWLPLENGKKVDIDFVQYVYAAYVDSAEKREKASPETREDKVLQIFAKITPEESKDDNFMLKVKKFTADDLSKTAENEFFVVTVNNLNSLIKR
ncbi:MAG: hypothetical protein U0457_20795 [Candidatus Sericytochromatia bacterium]